MMKIALALLASIAATSPALAQYYSVPPPPPGYGAPPGYAPPGYPAPGYPPPGYPPPGYDRQPFGRRCDAVLRTQYGPRRLVCEIIRPKPLGEPCACPPPEPPPGYAPGPYVDGRTIR